MSERELFLAALDVPDPADRAALLDRACAGDPDLRRRVEALLRSHEDAASFLNTPAVRAAPPPDGEPVTADHHTDPNSTRTQDSPPAAAPREDLGTVVGGRYTLVEMIGEGGMGSVYRAAQSDPVKRQVALKLVRAGMDSRAVLARFDAERQALALMDHPNIARIYDGGVTPAGRPYFVMELVDGVPITDFCDAKRLSPRARLELFVPVCQAIQHAHQKGIIHRDIKPSNVLVAEDAGRPVPKVIDFGVAKATGGQLADHTLHTGVGGVVGTPQYMSPEQAGLHNQDIDTRSDVYSLGVLLYELLTGSPPFTKKELEKKGLFEILRVVREETPPKPSTRLSTADALPSLSANRATEPRELTRLLRSELDWVVMKALEKDRARRYETANGFAADVLRYLSGEPVLAHPPSRGYRLKKFLRKNRGPVLASLLVAGALVGGVVGTTLGLLEARDQARRADDARRDEAGQRELAEQANQQAVAALRSFTDDLMSQLLGSRDKLTDTEKALLRNAQKQWDVFAGSKGQSPKARDIRGEGATQLARIQSKLGLVAEAEANDRKAVALREGLVSEFPTDPRYRKRLATSYQNLGSVLRGHGNPGEARGYFARAVEVYAALVADFPADADHRQHLAEAHISLGNATRDLGELGRAEAEYRAALGHQETLVAAHPDVADYRVSLARSHWGLAFTKKRLDQIPESEAHYRAAVGGYQVLAGTHPGVITYRRELAGLHRELGVTLTDAGRPAAGAAEFPPAVRVLGALAAEFPSVPGYRFDLGRAHRDYGKALRLVRQRAAAVEQFVKSAALFEALLAANPASLAYQADVGLVYLFHGDVFDAPTERPRALEWYDKAMRVLAAAHAADPKQVLIKYSVGSAHAARAEALDDLKRHTEAVREWDSAIALAPPHRVPLYRAKRVGALLRAGRAADAANEVAELAADPKRTGRELYDFACAAAAAGTPPDAERVLELLERAAAAGFADAEALAGSPHLGAVRGRPEFRKLVAAAEAVAPPPRGKIPAEP